MADVTAECEVASITAPTATDNCAGTITGTTTDPLTYNTQGTHVINWSFDDGNGNVTNETQNVVISDVTAPVADVTTLADVTAECSVASITAPTATDNCAGIITGTTNTTSPITDQGTTVVTWTYDDGNGNTSTQTQNVVISDVTAPVADVTTLADVTAECSVTSITAPTATDNCAGIITATTTDPLTYNTQGTHVINWSFDDGNGNVTNETQNVVISDVTAPVADVTTLADVTAECSVASITAPTATDNCAGTITATTTDPLTYNTQGTHVINWSFDDGNGNVTNETQNVVISDVTAPVADVTTLADVSAECEVASITAPTATDNCAGTITGTTTDPLTYNTQGTHVINWSFDDGNGNVTNETQNVVISDVTGPVADVTTLADVTAECSVASITAPTATDNCAGTITGTTTDPLTYNTQGTHVINWSFDDGNGNVTNETQNVVISDVTAPVADVTTLADVTAECSVASITAPTATDNCAGTITGTTTDPLTYNTQGTHVINWSFDDGNGNVTNETQNVVISDVTAPVADVTTLADVTAECSVASITAPTATDNCAGTITGTTTDPLTYNTQGTHVINWSFDDGNGNVTNETQNVVISDVTAPVADVTTLADVSAECAVASITAPTATDNCAGTITGTTTDTTSPITDTRDTLLVTWTL